MIGRRSVRDVEEMWRAIQEHELEWEKWFVSDKCNCEGKCVSCIFFSVCKVRVEIDSRIGRSGTFSRYNGEEWESFIERLYNTIEQSASSMTLQERREIFSEVQRREEKYTEWTEWYLSDECDECEDCPYNDVCELPNYDKEDREGL